MANKQTMNQKQAEKAKGQKPERSVRAGLVALDLFLSLAVVGTVGFYLYRVGSSFEKIDMLESSTLLAASGEESSQPEAEGDQSVYDNVFVKTDAVYSGDLILVNNDTEYHSGQETGVTPIQRVVNAIQENFCIYIDAYVKLNCVDIANIVRGGERIQCADGCVLCCKRTG